jgi:hypothetical protein
MLKMQWSEEARVIVVIATPDVPAVCVTFRGVTEAMERTYNLSDI